MTQNRTYDLFVFLTMSCLALASPGTAAELVKEPLVREIFVPFEDLEVIMQAGGQRVFLGRQEYEELLAKAKVTAASLAPVSITLVASMHDITVEDRRVRISSRLTLDVSNDGWQAVNLPLQFVGVRSATLDGQPAALAKMDNEQGVKVFVTGKGSHELLLELTAPLEIAAAQQIIRYQLPAAATGLERLVIPGNVEMKSGANVLRRTIDENAEVTRFELLPQSHATELVLSVNNRLAQRDRVVLARGVHVAEITETYQRLHVTASMKILHGAAEQFRFAVPDDFEVTNVATPQLSRWEVSQRDGERQLEIALRQPATDTVVINISAQRTTSLLDAWKMPILKPLEVAGTAMIMGLLVEPRLEVQALEATGLIPIDVNVLTKSLPPTVLQAEPGAPALQPFAAFYAPSENVGIDARITKPTGRVRVISNTLLMIKDSGLEVQGGFALQPLAEKIFGCNFSVEPGWRVTEVTYAGGQPLAFEQYVDDDGTARIRVDLPQGVPPGEAYGIYFRAQHTPVDWLDSWKSREVQFPRFAIADATSDRGAIAVVGGEDLQVLPAAIEGLVPLDERKKGAFNLDEVATDLAFQYESPDFTASFDVRRLESRMTAESYSFLKIEPGNLLAHYEIIYDIKAARTKVLSFRLPDSTAEEVSIRGLDEVAVKDSTSSTDNGFRQWEVTLEKPARGTVRLEVRFQQRLAHQQESSQEDVELLIEDFSLPIMDVTGLDYQTGFVAVDGDAELEIELETDARKIDAGELVDADYQPGRRLLGAFGFVGDPLAVKMKVTRPVGYGLPTAIVSHVELNTAIAKSGLAQTSVLYRLRIKADFVQLQLPTDSTLWSTLLDGLPAKPQRDGDRLLISIPAKQETAPREIRVVFETPIQALSTWGHVHLPAPRLYLRNRNHPEPIELPLADLQWNVTLPSGYVLSSNHGTVFPDLQHRPTQQQIGARPTAAEYAAAALIVSPSIHAVRESYIVQGKLRQGATSQSALELGDVADNRFRSRAVEGEQLQRDSLAVDSIEISGLPADTLEDEESDPFDDADGEELDEPFGETAAEKSEDAGGAQADFGILSDLVQSTIEPDSWDVTDGRDDKSKLARGTPWGFEGRRSLQIDLVTGDNQLAFRSLGATPVLDVRLVDRNRVTMLSSAVAVAVIAFGLFLLPTTTQTKVSYVILVLVTATALPVLLGWEGQLSTMLDPAFYAAIVLTGIYIFVAFLEWLKSVSGLQTRMTTTAVLVVAMVLLRGQNSASAQQPEVQLGPLTVKLEQPEPPAVIPADAVIIPFALDNLENIEEAERVIVPREKYTELWNRAFPDQKLNDAPPIPYVVSTARWETSLSDDSDLLLTGQLNVEVFADKPVSIVLPLVGGVLARAEADGQPARVQTILSKPAENANETAQQSANAKSVAPPAGMIAIYLDSPGPHKLQLDVRFRRTRRGGWHVARGQLPVASASALELRVPRSETEVRLTGIVDRTNYETEVPNETISTALSSTGTFDFQWRPKVAAATVDRALTAHSTSIVDVQEDRLRVIWQLELEFPQTERDIFSLRIPTDYIVEQVRGENISSWQVDDGQMTVNLLATARDRQQITLHLARATSLYQQEAIEFDVPAVQVPDAVLHDGRVALRRSPLIELRAINTDGLSRTDFGTIKVRSSDAVESPLGIRPFQAYAFHNPTYTLRLSSRPVASRLWAKAHTLLRVSELERTLESRILITPIGRPIYQLQVVLPEGLQVENVNAPGGFQWSVSEIKSESALTLFLDEGQSDPFSLVISGLYGERTKIESAELPRLTVPAADRQESVIVVQTDPGYDAVAESLQNCEAILLRSTFGWLVPDQRLLSRLAIRSTSNEFGGQIRLQRKPSRVRCQTISNLRVTSSDFEETILLDFTIDGAGVREVVFTLPEGLAGADIQAPMIRTKTIEPIENQPLVRVRLSLQDDITGQFRVLVQNDRLATSDEHDVPLPIVETGRVEHQFVSLESAGHHEVVVAESKGLEALTRQQQQWTALAEVLGTGITQAFVVASGADTPRLAVRLQQRQMVETVGARIVFATTQLVVDASGAYRGVQNYQVDNSTEQFLEIELPESASLWTAMVAREPVKPVTGVGNLVRIPLVKTDQGDPDYPVQLKYGGRMDRLGKISAVQFPLIRTRNIKVQESQVRLWLPESYRWFNFGGSMRLVTGEAGLMEGYLQYQGRQLQAALSYMSSENPYTRVRAMNNLKQLSSGLENYSQSHEWFMKNSKLSETIQSNRKAIERAEQLAEANKTEQVELQVDNRGRLNEFLGRQSNDFSINQVNEQGANFVLPQEPESGKPDEDKSRQIQLQKKWLFDNSLVVENFPESLAEQRILGEKKKAKQLDTYDFESQRGKDLDRPQVQSEQSLSQSRRSAGRSSQEKAQRFAERLEKQQLEGSNRRNLFFAQSANRSGILSVDGNYNQSAGSPRPSNMGLLGKDGRPDSANTKDGEMQRGSDIKGFSGGMGGGFGGAGFEGPRIERGGPAGGGLGLARGKTGLVSLDVPVPLRGVEYRFTTPRGDIAIEARAIQATFWHRLVRLIACVAAIAVLVLIVRWINQRGFDTVFGRGVSIVVVLLGAIMFLVQLVPMLALLMVIFGIVQLVRVWRPVRVTAAGQA